MPVMILQTGVGNVPTLTAGASVNVVAGQQYEFLPFHANVRIAIVTTATGVLATVYSGTDLLMQEGAVQIKPASTLPTYPDDFHLIDDVAAGDRLSVTVRNTTAGTLVVIVVIQIEPL